MNNDFLLGFSLTILGFSLTMLGFIINTTFIPPALKEAYEQGKIEGRNEAKVYITTNIVTNVTFSVETEEK